MVLERHCEKNLSRSYCRDCVFNVCKSVSFHVVPIVNAEYIVTIGRSNGGGNDRIGNNNVYKALLSVMIAAVKYLINKNNCCFC